MGIASLSGAMAVALGAYASHGLKLSLTPDALAIVQTALNYQFIHTLALLLVSLITVKSKFVILSGSLFILGILFFSFNLYAIQIFQFATLSKLTPVGGVFFILGWLSLFVLALKKPNAEKNTDH